MGMVTYDGLNGASAQSCKTDRLTEEGGLNIFVWKMQILLVCQYSFVYSKKKYVEQEISLKKIFGGSQILTILTKLSDEIPLYSLSLHAGKGCFV